MAVENNDIQEKLTATFGEAVSNFHQDRDIFTLEITADVNTAVILFLKNDPALRFHFLTDYVAYTIQKTQSTDSLPLFTTFTTGMTTNELK